jgi:hypothetical protein
MLSLILAGSDVNRVVDFVYRHIIDGRDFYLDTREIRLLWVMMLTWGSPRF